MTDHNPHPVSKAAALHLQQRLASGLEWNHNFGLGSDTTTPVIGKMFGVLVVRTADDQYGYLSAFSGKLAGGNHHPGFVPPVFDSLADDSFLNEGMRELGRINDSLANEDDNAAITLLQDKRRSHSNSLQHRLFAEYQFTNRNGDIKNANEIFRAAGYRNPPSGAGECAGPKLLQYAFRDSLEPVALAEFWWGKSPKSAQWVHQQYYPCCRQKCEPILAHMLS